MSSTIELKDPWTVYSLTKLNDKIINIIKKIIDMINYHPKYSTFLRLV